MARIGIAEAFWAYGADPATARSPLSSETSGGIVLSPWESGFQKQVMPYVKDLSRHRGPEC
jgi:hypothetical protein